MVKTSSKTAEKSVVTARAVWVMPSNSRIPDLLPAWRAAAGTAAFSGRCTKNR